MSLTSLIETSKNIKSQFREVLPKPYHFRRPPVIVPSSCQQPSWIGTALDYLLRWTIKRNQKGSYEESWVAESVLNVGKMENHLRIRIIAQIQHAREVHASYIKGAALSDELLRSAVELARIDPIYRAGVGHQFILQEVDDSYVHELRRLMEIVPPELIHVDKYVHLNPTFRDGGIVGGADADLILDGYLIDFKTTSDTGFRREYLNQLIGYYLLYCLGGIDGCDVQPIIEYIGVYFSRAGKVVCLHVADLGSRKDYECLAAVLISEAFERNPLTLRRTRFVQAIKEPRKGFGLKPFTPSMFDCPPAFE